MERINVTKPYLPPLEDYTRRVKEIFDCGILTGQAVSGPQGQMLENKLSKFLGVENFLSFIHNQFFQHVFDVFPPQNLLKDMF